MTNVHKTLHSYIALFCAKGDNIMGYINESVIYNIYPLGFAEHQRKMISNRNTDLTKFTAGLTI